RDRAGPAGIPRFWIPSNGEPTLASRTCHANGLGAGFLPLTFRSVVPSPDPTASTSGPGSAHLPGDSPTAVLLPQFAQPFGLDSGDGLLILTDQDLLYGNARLPWTFDLGRSRRGLLVARSSGRRDSGLTWRNTDERPWQKLTGVGEYWVVRSSQSAWASH